MMIPIERALRTSGSSCIAFTGAGGKTTALFYLAKTLSKTSPVVVTASSHLGAWQVSLADRHLIVEPHAKLDDLASNLKGVSLITGPLDGDRTKPMDEDNLNWLNQFCQQHAIPDPAARHVLAFAKNRDAIGTGRLEPTGKIGRVAVLPQYRGTGVGRRIMVHLVNHATESGFTKVYLHAQAAAAGFYARLGFRAEGPVFVECGIPHLRMTLGITGQDGIESGRRGHEEHPLDAR